MSADMVNSGAGEFFIFFYCFCLGGLIVKSELGLRVQPWDSSPATAGATQRSCNRLPVWSQTRSRSRSPSNRHPRSPDGWSIPDSAAVLLLLVANPIPNPSKATPDLQHLPRSFALARKGRKTTALRTDEK